VSARATKEFFMSYRFTILGCGSSGGNPRVGCDWGKCDSSNPKNRRRRAAALFERREPSGVTTILVDTGPDVREQLLSVRLKALDGVLYTHDHADHTHGIDDLRALSYMMKRRIPVWFDAPTRDSLTSRFAYIFDGKPGSSYPPILKANLIEPPTPIVVDGPGGAITALPVRQIHGDIESIAFRVGNLAYSPDVSGIPESSVPLLEGLDVWIVDALRHTPHPSHFSLKEALAWIERLKPKRAILTHLLGDLDYDALRRDLPPHIEPAYDGMTIEYG
jgi:phosphoribosyl 1,2-cyclic phosphate phosphodiesterase